MSDQADYQIVHGSSLGTELSEAEARVLAGIMGVIHLRDDEILVREGDPNRSLHLLAAGRLAVTREVGEHPAILYVLKLGEAAGTRAFVDGTARQATLQAIGAATVYTLDPAPFEKLLDNHPRIVYCVMRAIFRVAHTVLLRMNREREELSNYITKHRGRY
jgi:CRP-like cAMP-binding protein